MVDKMRLIDAEKVIADLKAMKDVAGYDAILIDGMIKGLENAPTVDAVEVVRCKDCIYGQCEPIKNGTRVCEYDFFIVVNDYDFCSRGERRSDNAAD